MEIHFSLYVDYDLTAVFAAFLFKRCLPCVNCRITKLIKKVQQNFMHNKYLNNILNSCYFIHDIIPLLYILKNVQIHKFRKNYLFPSSNALILCCVFHLLFQIARKYGFMLH